MNTVRFKTGFLIAAGFAFFAALRCGTVASVRPLGTGNRALTLSSAGPVAPLFGIDMPLPYAVLRYRRGIRDDIDLHGGLHLTMLYLGNAGLDAGITKHLFPPSGVYPGLAIETGFYAFCHLTEASSVRAFPLAGVHGHYDFGGGPHTFYFGSHALFQYTAPYAVLAPFTGVNFSFRRISFALEGKWYAPTEDTEHRVVDYKLKPFDRGALGLAWGVSFRF